MFHTLYLFIEKPFFQYQTIKDIDIGFTLKSKDNRFVCDYYDFGIINYQGWNEKGDDVYLSLKEFTSNALLASACFLVM